MPVRGGLRSWARVPIAKSGTCKSCWSAGSRARWVRYGGSSIRWGRWTALMRGHVIFFAARRVGCLHPEIIAVIVIPVHDRLESSRARCRALRFCCRTRLRVRTGKRDARITRSRNSRVLSPPGERDGVRGHLVYLHFDPIARRGLAARDDLRIKPERFMTPGAFERGRDG